jgi:hypothetical protein
MRPSVEGEVGSGAERKSRMLTAWMREKPKLWLAHPWSFAAGFAAGLGFYELIRAGYF